MSALVFAVMAPPAAADLGPDGTTAPTYSYQDATRERVYIPQPGIDQDGDGVADRIAIEIVRPAESGPSLKVPAIIDPSPYYSTLCRGNEGECIGDVNADGTNDRWPLFYDNFFVPRGYAVILAESNGTANSSGCPLHGGPGDVAGMKSVIDWLNGRVPGVDGQGNPVVADWHNGKAALIGKSYDGTLANGVAATGVAGLETIVPISAISNWYGYSRMGGIRFNTHYPASLSNAVTDSGRRATCLASRNAMSAADGDATGDMNAFWDDRNYLAGVSHVHAAVFATHGLQDDNVRPDQFSTWWAGLAAAGVPRKLWLLREGHVDPFDSRRAAWVDTLHRWFDHWLYGVDNGIMDAPRVDIEDSRDTWNTYADWPVPGTADTAVYLRGLTADGAGALRLAPGGPAGTLSWTDQASQSESAMINDPEGAQLHRRVFLSRPLAHDLRVSGTPVVSLEAALSTTQSNLGALLVDYGPSDQITRSGDGIASTATSSCWGESSTGLNDFDACYFEVTKPLTHVTQWRVGKGILDSANRTSLTTPEPVTIDEPTHFSWPLIPDDYVFAAGHRIGVVLVANYRDFSAVSGATGTTVTMDAKRTKVTLPIVGGDGAAASSGAFTSAAPTLHGLPRDTVVTATGPGGARVAYGAPTATDDETADTPVTCAPASGSLFAIGRTTVSCSAGDEDGNTTTGAFRVTVRARVVPRPPTGGGSGPVVPPHVDTRAPRLRELRLQSRRHAIRVRFRLTEFALATVTLRRAGVWEPRLDSVALWAGAHEHARTLRSPRLRRGLKYVIEVRAADTAGNRARTIRRLLTFHGVR